MFEYSHKNGDISIINYFHKTCTCSFFNDRAMCVHLIRVATLEKVLIPGLQIDNKFSINYRRKELKKSKNNNNLDEDFSADTESEIEENEENDVANEVTVVISNVVIEQPLVSTANIEPIKLKRGRPKRNGKALENDTPIIETPHHQQSQRVCLKRACKLKT